MPDFENSEGLYQLNLSLRAIDLLMRYFVGIGVYYGAGVLASDFLETASAFFVSSFPLT